METIKQLSDQFKRAFTALKTKLDNIAEKNKGIINARLDVMRDRDIEEIKKAVNELDEETALRLDDELLAVLEKLNITLLEEEQRNWRRLQTFFLSEKFDARFRPYKTAQYINPGRDESFSELTNLSQNVDLYICADNEFYYVTKKSVKIFVKTLMDEGIIGRDVMELFTQILD